jgi:hypothetical protein
LPSGFNRVPLIIDFSLNYFTGKISNKCFNRIL